MTSSLIAESIIWLGIQKISRGSKIKKRPREANEKRAPRPAEHERLPVFPPPFPQRPPTFAAQRVTLWLSALTHRLSGIRGSAGET